jgi:hypothetical protein
MIKRINLPMRVIDRCSNIATTVFKNQNVFNIVALPKRGCATGP